MFPVYTDICGAKFALFYGKSGIPRIVLGNNYFCRTTRLQRIRVRKNPFTE